MPSDWSDFIEDTWGKKPEPPPNGGTAFNGLVAAPTNGVRERSYALSGLRRECEELAAMPPNSGRNNKLNEAVFSLIGFVPQTLSEEEVVDNLGAAALSAGLPLGEAQATIKSALRGSKQKGVVRAAPPPTPDWFTQVAMSNLATPPYVMPPAAAPPISPVAEFFGADPTPPPVSNFQIGNVDPGVSTANGNANTGADPDDSPDAGPGVLERIEADFWSARPELELIFTAAMARMASPWAVLAGCVARSLCLVPPAITLPEIVGDRGSLNWFAAIVAKSGGGKGAAMSVARRLVPGDILTKPIGSGEGMIECYDRAPRKGKDDNPPPPVISILFDVAEVDSLGALGNRTGQTTLAVLRQGFSGETLGYSYRGRQSEQVVEHTYRMALIVAVQPLRAGVLLDDGGGGIPQRFMWFPARDRRITVDVPDWPVDDMDRPRIIPSISVQDIARAAGSVNVPREIWEEVREARAASMRDDDNALDGHAVFAREKLAYALAFMNGRTAIDLEDWRLSGIAANVSDWIRSKAIDDYRSGQAAESRSKGELRGVENASAEKARILEQLAPARTLELVRNRLAKIGGEGATKKQLKDVVGRNKGYLTEALNLGLASGMIVQKGARWVLVEGQEAVE